MKKEYISPDVTLLLLDTVAMIATSPTDDPEPDCYLRIRRSSSTEDYLSDENEVL